MSATAYRKYGNVKTDVDGYTFASKSEARRYGELALMQKAGEIANLYVQPRFTIYVEDVKVCVYIGDFSYADLRHDGRFVVEDVKSSATRTASYRLKKKLLRATHGIEIFEVMS